MDWTVISFQAQPTIGRSLLWPYQEWDCINSHLPTHPPKAKVRRPIDPTWWVWDWILERQVFGESHVFCLIFLEPGYPPESMKICEMMWMAGEISSFFSCLNFSLGMFHKLSVEIIIFYCIKNVFILYGTWYFSFIALWEFLEHHRNLLNFVFL